LIAHIAPTSGVERAKNTKMRYTLKAIIPQTKPTPTDLTVYFGWRIILFMIPKTIPVTTAMTTDITTPAIGSFYIREEEKINIL
jgi:hypothetical protein